MRKAIRICVSLSRGMRHWNEAHQSFNRFSLLLLSLFCKVNLAQMELNENGFPAEDNEDREDENSAESAN